MEVDVDVKRMCVLSGQGLVGLVSNAWGRLRQGRRDETRQDRLWGINFLCCGCYKAPNGRQGKVQGASGSESRRALAIRSLNLTHLGQVETHEHPSLTSHSLERGPWGQAP